MRHFDPKMEQKKTIGVPYFHQRWRYVLLITCSVTGVIWLITLSWASLIDILRKSLYITLICYITLHLGVIGSYCNQWELCLLEHTLANQQQFPALSLMMYPIVLFHSMLDWERNPHAEVEQAGQEASPISSSEVGTGCSVTQGKRNQVLFFQVMHSGLNGAPWVCATEIGCTKLSSPDWG